MKLPSPSSEQLLQSALEIVRKSNAESKELMYIVHFLDTEEKYVVDHESEVKEIFEQMSWEKHRWTPLLQENTNDGLFELYVHSDTYDEDDDIYDEEGIQDWESRGYDLNDDDGFWEKFQEEFKVKVDVVRKDGQDTKVNVQEYQVVWGDIFRVNVELSFEPQASRDEIIDMAFKKLDELDNGFCKYENFIHHAEVYILNNSRLRIYTPSPVEFKTE